MNTSGKVGAARYELTISSAGKVRVYIRRDYAAGAPGSTAHAVWRIVADFAGIKALFPSLLSVYVVYPDPTSSVVNTVRHMIFAPADGSAPVSAKNPLSFGVEQLVALDERRRTLTYVSVAGMPVRNYRSVMSVSGRDACELNWTSSFSLTTKEREFAAVLARILAAGANEVDQHLWRDHR